ncbi:MAG: hypothetical protein R3279_07495 [Putridiphycobacter sp.]|nr:hypothetical protein [Putridiphycobacter sp.]
MNDSAQNYLKVRLKMYSRKEMALLYEVGDDTFRKELRNAGFDHLISTPKHSKAYHSEDAKKAGFYSIKEVQQIFDHFGWPEIEESIARKNGWV